MAYILLGLLLLLSTLADLWPWNQSHPSLLWKHGKHSKVNLKVLIFRSFLNSASKKWVTLPESLWQLLAHQMKFPFVNLTSSVELGGRHCFSEGKSHDLFNCSYLGVRFQGTIRSIISMKSNAHESNIMYLQGLTCIANLCLLTSVHQGPLQLLWLLTFSDIPSPFYCLGPALSKSPLNCFLYIIRIHCSVLSTITLFWFYFLMGVIICL